MLVFKTSAFNRSANPPYSRFLPPRLLDSGISLGLFSRSARLQISGAFREAGRIIPRYRLLPLHYVTYRTLPSFRLGEVFLREIVLCRNIMM